MTLGNKTLLGFLALITVVALACAGPDDGADSEGQVGAPGDFGDTLGATASALSLGCEFLDAKLADCDSSILTCQGNCQATLDFELAICRGQYFDCIGRCTGNWGCIYQCGVTKESCESTARSKYSMCTGNCSTKRQQCRDGAYGPCLRPLYRYWNPYIMDHFYTANWGELGSGSSGYAWEGVSGYALAAKTSQSTPLYRYWNGAIGDHFYTTSWSELGGGGNGWSYEGIAGYVFVSSGSSRAPFYRYWNPTATDHFYTTNWNEVGNGNYGWALEGTAGYLATSTTGL
ncbi:MAG: hypothetical protein HY698_21145 [Deltaproteobacteria bacterium]|nr:hypothetical protein [Deltaproteobacteria bacterium]